MADNALINLEPRIDHAAFRALIGANNCDPNDLLKYFAN